MDFATPSTSSKDNETARILFAAVMEHLCAAQNADGGWAFHQGGESRVEPTCWALLALANRAGSSAESAPRISRGLAYLKSHQLADGSWATASGMSSGGWVTSLATLALAEVGREKENERSLEAGLQWICDDYPRDSSRWRKFLKSLSSAKVESHNDEFRGWGWTPRTSSWVEPTAFALLAFAAVDAVDSKTQVQTANLGHPSSGEWRVASGEQQTGGAERQFLSPVLEKQIAERRELAVGLLYDRMCAGGGWNCGNPRVYGVDGDSLVIPTCWALLALRDSPDHANRALSLGWLQRAVPAMTSAGSLAVAQITLQNYNMPVPASARSLSGFSAHEITEQGTHVASWTALALNSARAWPAATSVSSGSKP